MLAIPWYFAQRGISSQFNIIFAVITFATIFWGLFAGTLVDRFNRRGLFLSTNIVEGTLLLLVAGAGWLQGSLPLPLIVLVFTITVFGYRMHYPNLYAFVQEISLPKHYTRATSYIEIVGQASNVMAGAMAVVLLEGVDAHLPLIGHITIEAWEIYEIFTLDGITYFMSVFLISFIRYIPDKVFKVDRSPLVSRLKTGFKFLKDHPTVFLFGFFTHSIFVILLVSLFTVMPMYITHFLKVGGEVFGGMEMLYGVGALMAGIFIGRWTQRWPKVKVIIFFMFLTTLLLTMCALIKSVPYYFTVGFLIGFANAGTRILRVSYLFDHIPNQVIGRVNSVFSVLNLIMRTSFILVFSLAFFAQGENITYAYYVMAGYTLLSGVVLLRYYPKFRV